MAPIDAPTPVFPQELATRVFRFCDAVASDATWSKAVATVGTTPMAWRTLLAHPQPGVQAGLASPTHASQAYNPSFYRSHAQPPVVSPSPGEGEVGRARQALYDATRAMMRFAPSHSLTTELFDAACEAWLAQVTDASSLATYSASRAVLQEVRTIWLEQATWSGLNLMGHAELPPFLDGCLQLERLFIQQLHPACDVALFGRLSQLKAVTLHACQDAQLVARFAAEVPRLSEVQQEGEATFLMLPGESPCLNPWL